MTDQRPIPTPDNEQVEFLTQLGRRRTTRAPAIRRALREATRTMARLATLTETMDLRHEPNPDMLVIRQLEHILAGLVHLPVALVEAEARDLQTERHLWRQIAH